MKQKSIKLKYLFRFGKGLSITKESLSETGIPCVSYGQVHSKYGVILDMSKHVLPFVSGNYLATSSQALIKQGDFVFADTSEDKAGSGNFTCLVSDSSIFAGYHTVIARPTSKNVFHKYFAYYFDSQNFRAQIQQVVSGIKVFTISQGMLKNATASFPNTDEQIVIANYLDRKTAQIDSVIADKEKLIELLKEKRQAIISETVTRGLDTSVPMKDSGIDWIGQIPTHWEMSQSQWLFSLRKDRALPDDEQLTASQQMGILYQKDYMEQGSRVVQVITGADILKHVEPNDFVISMRSFQGGIEWSGLRGKISSAYVMLVPNVEQVHSPFFKWLLKSDKYICALQSTSNLVRDGQALRYDNFRQVDLPIVPLGEQKEIADYLFKRTLQIDKIAKEVSLQLELLKEYRQSIISEAVTGKIKVADSEMVATAERSRAKTSGANVHFKRRVLAAKILDKLCGENTLGHVKLEKLLFLSEYCAELDMHTEYVRYAAGPYSPKVLRSIDTQLQKAKWFVYDKNNHGSKYCRLDKSTEYAPYFDANFSVEQNTTVERLVELFRTVDTERCEIVATLYGAWNDFLIDGCTPTDEQIADEVLTHWSEEKKRIDKDRWIRAIGWMRKHKIVPCGYGEKTKRRDI
ncbi:MAG: restriction endonuclease subunit S [Oscillospiraceae bacterium]